MFFYPPHLFFEYSQQIIFTASKLFIQDALFLPRTLCRYDLNTGKKATVIHHLSAGFYLNNTF
jgi:hypothetical protein